MGLRRGIKRCRENEGGCSDWSGVFAEYGGCRRDSLPWVVRGPRRC